MPNLGSRLPVLLGVFGLIAAQACGSGTHMNPGAPLDASSDAVGSGGTNSGDAGADSPFSDGAGAGAAGGSTLEGGCDNIKPDAPCPVEGLECGYPAAACPTHEDVAHCDNGVWWIEPFDYPLGTCPAEPLHDGERCDPCYWWSWSSFDPCTWCVSTGPGRTTTYMATCNNSSGPMVNDVDATWTVTTSTDAGACGDAGLTDAGTPGDATPGEAGSDASGDAADGS